MSSESEDYEWYYWRRRAGEIYESGELFFVIKGPGLLVPFELDDLSMLDFLRSFLIPR